MTAAGLRDNHNGSGSVDEDLNKRRRQEIMLGACAVFDERGYADTRIADICSHLRIGQGTVYRYFTGKSDLMDHIIAYAVRRLLSAMREDPSVTGDPARSGARFTDQITAVTHRLLEMATAEPVLVRVVLNQAPAAAPEAINELTDQLSAATVTYLDLGVKEGYLRQGLETRAVADAMVGVAMPAMRRVLRGQLDATGRADVARAIGCLIGSGVVNP